MKYVELRTGSSAESPLSRRESTSVSPRASRSASGESHGHHKIGEKETGRAALPLTICELKEDAQRLPVVQAKDLLDERGELHRATVLRTVVREVIAEELPREHPAVVQKRREPEEEDADAVVTRPGPYHQLRLLIGVGVLDTPALLVPADDPLRAILVVERPVGTARLPENRRNVIEVQHVRFVAVGEGIETLLTVADDGVEVVLAGVVPVGFGDDADLLREVVRRRGDGIPLVVVEAPAHGRERALELVAPALQADRGRDVTVAAQLQDARRLETRIQPECVDRNVVVCLVERALDEIVRADVLRVGFDPDRDVLVVLLIVGDERGEVKAVGRPVLRFALPVDLGRVVGLGPVRDDGDVDGGVQVSLEHPRAGHGPEDAAVDALELFVPAGRVPLLDSVERRLDGEVVTVVLDDVRRTVAFLGGFEERREDIPRFIGGVAGTVKVSLFEHDRPDVPDLLVYRLVGDLRQRFVVAPGVSRFQVRPDEIVREPGFDPLMDVLGVVLEERLHAGELLANGVTERGVIEVVVEPEQLPNRRIAFEVALQLEERPPGEDAVDVRLRDGLGVFTAKPSRPSSSRMVGPGSSAIACSPRAGSAAARVSPVTHVKNPRTIDKSSPTYGPNSTTSANGEAIA